MTFDSFEIPGYLPPDWKFCKVRGKAPFEKGWEDKHYPRAIVQGSINSGEATGYGLITGVNGYMAVDIDGINPMQRLLDLSGGTLPDTVSWTSGKPNRMQLLFKITRQQAMDLFYTPNKGRWFEDWGAEGGEDYEQLDFRFYGFQSVLPPSPHPDTGKPYEWINSPETYEVAELPDYLVKHVEDIRDGKGHKAERRRAAPKAVSNGNGNGKSHNPQPELEVDIIEFLDKDVLSKLTVEQIYGPYTQLENYGGGELRGTCPIHFKSENRSSCSIDQDTKRWHCFSCKRGGGPTQFIWQIQGNEGTPRGKDFIDIVRGLAALANVVMPSKPKFSAQELLEMWLRDEQESKNNKNPDSKPQTPKKKSQFAIKSELVEAIWGHRLRLNTLSHEVEFDGKRITLEDARLKLGKEGLELGREDCWDIVLGIAKENAYNPVQEYLERTHKTVKPNNELLHKMATTFLGTTEPLFDIYVRKAMITSVARAYDPGCKLDTALVLQGGQGQNKSSFFEVLASEKWFDNSMGDTKDKDQLLKVHSSWWIEWAELETIFGKRDQSQVKAFMSTRIDNIRVPYGRQSEKMKRPSVICGTTNETDFLNDSSGNRRYWVIPVTCERINLKLLREQRDSLWAAAVDEYLKGRYQYEGTWHYNDHLYWLSPEEQRSSQELNEFFTSQHPWINLVRDFIEFKTQVQVADILAQIKPEAGQRTKADMNSVTDCLRKLGWTPARRYIEGKQTRVWVAPAPVSSQDTRQQAGTKNDSLDGVDSNETRTEQPLQEPQDSKTAKTENLNHPNTLNGSLKENECLVSLAGDESNTESEIQQQDSIKNTLSCNVLSVLSSSSSTEERDIEGEIDCSLSLAAKAEFTGIEEEWHEV